MKRNNHRVAAFSLIELLLSIGIVVILAAIAVPIISSVRSSALSAQCANNLRTLSSGFQTYAMSHDGNMPQDSSSWPNWIHQLMPVAIFDEDVYRRYYPNGGPIPTLSCPQSTEKLELYWHSDYGINTNVLSMKVAGGGNEYTGTKPYERYSRHGQIILASDFYNRSRLIDRNRLSDALNSGNADKILRHNGRANVVFLDGHVESLGTTELLKTEHWAEN